MNLKKFLAACLIGFGLLAQQPLFAQVHDMSISTPKQGQSMDSVTQQFGEPQDRIAAIGEPPISRWVYGNFTVYFEHNLVIHSVVHK